MTLPVALLLRLGELLGESFSLSLGGVGAWLLALLIPVAALFAPLVMFWQAGALFFFADRASRHALSAVPNSGSVVCVTGRRAQPTAAGTLGVAWPASLR